MVIIAGLGNPEKDYKGSRHNAGFLALDKIREKYSFPPFSFSKKFNSLISLGEIKGNKTILLKPQTYMNRSGLSIKKILSYYDISPSLLYLFHDDIDIPLGVIRISEGSGSAGHKGVKSVIENIGSNQFKRFRIGINREEREKTEVFVLKNFDKEEEEKVNSSLDILIEKLEEEI